MTRKFRLAIVRASNDGTTLSDDACRTYLMIGAQSVLTYWTDATNGWLDFLDSAMFPWVTITVNPASTDRVSTAGSALAAVRAANPASDPLAGFDGALVILHPGRGDVAQRDALGNVIIRNGQVLVTPNTPFDGGSNVIGDLPFSLVPTVSSDHTFACHELGHTLGFDHTFGVLNSGIDYSGVGARSNEYGSPHDLMSSATFGSSAPISGVTRFVDPTFTGDSVAGWPGTFGMGPALSRANLHVWFPEALAGQVLDAAFPAYGSSAVFRIAKAASPGGHTLLALHPADETADGVGRVYVEYRPAEGWDRGLDEPGNGIARAGVVVHTLETIPQKPPHAWFRGSIADDDVDTDLAVGGRQLVVTVSNRGTPGEDWVELTVTATANPSALVTVTTRDTISYGVDIRHSQTPCGDDIESGTWYTSTDAIARVITTGLEPAITSPEASVEWVVGGTSLTGPGASGVGVTAVDGSSRTIQYSIDPNTHELKITSEVGAQCALDIEASVSITGAPKGTPAGLDARSSFSASGSYTGVHPRSLAAIAQCIVKNSMFLPHAAIDLSALHDHHEVIDWERDTRTLQGVVASASGQLAERFRDVLGSTIRPVGVPVSDSSHVQVLTEPGRLTLGDTTQSPT